MSQPSPKGVSDFKVITFMVILSFVCATILSILASALGPAQEEAKDLDRSEQMMIAARILDHDGYFLITNEDGETVPAKYAGEGLLEPGSKEDIATAQEILAVYEKRFKAILIDKEGKITTFKEAGINQEEYVEDFKKTGYYKQPLMLAYEILPNSEEQSKPTGYIIPVNGMGLWAAIYGYLAIDNNGETVIGISWYDQQETPGLGANISEEEWQSQFPGKQVFQPAADGETNLETAPIGITVVKGKVNEVLGNSPKAKSAVDGMPGATLTGNGVTQAYKDVLSAYRPFLIKIHQEATSNGT